MFYRVVAVFVCVGGTECILVVTAFDTMSRMQLTAKAGEDSITRRMVIRSAIVRGVSFLSRVRKIIALPFSREDLVGRVK